MKLVSSKSSLHPGSAKRLLRESDAERHLSSNACRMGPNRSAGPATASTSSFHSFHGPLCNFVRMSLPTVGKSFRSGEWECTARGKINLMS